MGMVLSILIKGADLEVVFLAGHCGQEVGLAVVCVR